MPFRTAFVWSILVWAALNAGSCVVRTGGFGNLFGDRPEQQCRMGFPVTVWVEREVPESLLPVLRVLAVDVLAGVGLSVAVGLVAIRWRGRLVTPAAIAPPSALPTLRQTQYSLRGLLLLMTAFAIVLAVLRADSDPYRGGLKIVCLAGPYAMLWLAHAARRRAPVASLWVTVVFATLLLVAAAVLGQATAELHDFTRGLLALFVCWTPQLTLLIAALEISRHVSISRGTSRTGGSA